MANIKVDVTLNMPRILNKVENDAFGKYLANEWWKLMAPYTPRREGNLLETVEIRPFAIKYKSPYAHYMYNGVVYVDPITKVAGFMTDEGWKSRKNVEKIPSNRSINYTKGRSPYATDHWDLAAEQAGQKDKLIRSANNYLNRFK